MKTVLKLEEIGEFLLSIFLFNQLTYPWWLFPLLSLTPDVSMLGYLAGSRAGAVVYNVFRHKLVAVTFILAGFGLHLPVVSLIGTILFGHAALDRIFGFGLKYSDDFKHTHLGWLNDR